MSQPTPLPRKTILAVLVYIECGGKVLMLHRNAKENDDHKGKWNGLGGKLEPGESMLECAAREVREESGVALPLESLKPLGTLQFPDFKHSKSEDWIVFVFKARLKGSVESHAFWQRGPEGDLHWIDKDAVLKLNLWEGDRHFLPYVLSGDTFMGTFWYENGALSRHWIVQT